MTSFSYSGSELGVFASAVNWKSYWSDEIRHFIGESVLEIGAGIGSTSEILEGTGRKKWVAIEPDPSLCAAMQEKIRLGSIPATTDVRTGTSSNVRCDEVFDTVLYIDVLEHIEDDKAELCRVAGHLVEGGNIVIVAPAHNFLYSEFDKKIGHFRRYDKAMLRSIVPANMAIRSLYYLDSVGLLASLANRLLLRSSSPTLHQVRFWDRVMVTASRRLDALLGYHIGKSIICVLERRADQ